MVILSSSDDQSCLPAHGSQRHPDSRSGIVSTPISEPIIPPKFLHRVIVFLQDKPILQDLNSQGSSHGARDAIAFCLEKEHLKWYIPRYNRVLSSNSNFSSRPAESTPKPFSKLILNKRETTHREKKKQSTGFASPARINPHLNYSTQSTESCSAQYSSGSKNTTCTVRGKKKRAMQKPAVAGRADFIAGVKQEQKCSSRARSRSRISWLLLT